MGGVVPICRCIRRVQATSEILFPYKEAAASIWARHIYYSLATLSAGAAAVCCSHLNLNTRPTLRSHGLSSHLVLEQRSDRSATLAFATSSCIGRPEASHSQSSTRMWLPLLMTLCVGAMDPSLFLTGSRPRPGLEVLRPENGEVRQHSSSSCCSLTWTLPLQVLTSSELEIVLDIKGWDGDSLHGSSICIGIASVETSSEQCFPQTREKVFHAGGLVADTQYSLRVVVFERERAIAVSIRNFYVAGIRGFFGEQVLTIKTAVQVALSYQNSGDIVQAEKIYRSVLSVVPGYPDALHLLGLVFHQQGATETAVSYIERALTTNSKAFEGIHNSLGECYRVLGRLEEAEEQFNRALVINPGYISSIYNLGLVFQSSGRLDRAIAQFEAVGKLEVALSSEVRDVVVKSKVRECDLLAVVGRSDRSLSCWKEGAEQFPTEHIFYNELGAMLLRRSAHNYPEVLLYYQISSELGNHMAELHRAHVYEGLGWMDRAKESFELALSMMQSRGMPTFHIRIQLATVLPRVLPSPEALNELHTKLERTIRSLLLEKIQVDNIAPTDHGFSACDHLVTHGMNSKRIKMMLARVYIKFCPALQTGDYLSREYVKLAPKAINGPAVVDTAMMNQSNLAHVVNADSSDDISTPLKRLRIGIAGHYFYSHPMGKFAMGLVALLSEAGYEVIVFSLRDHDKTDLVTQNFVSYSSGTYFLGSDISTAIKSITESRLDALIFPTVGFDPLTYFLAFTRMAKVQVALMGHPETTGIPNIDFFISSTVAQLASSKYFSERMYRMRGLGTSFVDIHRNYTIYLRENPPNLAPEKQKILDSLHVPVNAHVRLQYIFYILYFIQIFSDVA